MKTRRILMALLMATVMIFAMSVSVAFADDDYYKEPDMTNVTGIEFEPADGSLLLEELVDGGYDYEEERDDVFYYSLWGKLFKDGNALILVNKNGSRSRFEYDSSKDLFISEDGYRIFYDDINNDCMNRQHQTPWGLGDHTFNLEYKGFKCELTATVVENSIAAVEYIPAEPYEFIENWGGWWRIYNGNKYYRYSYRIMDGDAIKLTMKDSSIKTYVYKYDEYDEDNFRRFHCKEDGTDISSQNFHLIEDQEQNNWVKGGDNYVTFKYAGKEYRIPVTIVGSPIDSISYEPVSPIVFIENLDGYMEKDDKDNEYFEYDEPEPQEGDKFIVVKNGSSKTYTYSREDELYICGDESIRRYAIEFNTNQDIKNWSLGSDNELTVSYLGRECTVPVTINENKVKGIAYVPAHQYEYEELDPDQGEWDEDSDGNAYFCYYRPDRAAGDKLTVTTDDGSVDYIYDDDKNGYVSESGDLIDYGSVWFSRSQGSNHWEPGKENFMEVEYMGRTCFVPVIIHANPVNVRKDAVSTAERFLKLRVARAENRRDDFTDKSFEALKKAADAVRALIADDNSDPEQILAATAAMKSAFNDLVDKSSDELQKLRNEVVSQANAAINAFNKLDPAKYTEESYNAAVKAAADLKSVLEDGEDAYITTIKTSTAALKDAIAKLKKIKADKSTNTMKVSAANKTLKVKALKRKAVTFKAVNVKKSQGKVTFTAKAKGKSAKALKFNKKTAKVTVKKGTKKGKYTIKITVKAAGNKSYKAMTITKTVKVTVK